MTVRNRLPRLAGALGALCLAAGLAVAGSGSAQAADTAPTTTATTRVAHPGTTTELTFTKAATGRSPKVTFTCSITYPYVTDTFLTGEFKWTSQVSCSIPLHMQGTTVLFQWGSSSAYAFGSSYNNTATVNNSNGDVYGIHTGVWGVNNNVELFPPAGYTTTMGAGCYYVTEPTDIHCTATTGPITAG